MSDHIIQTISLLLGSSLACGMAASFFGLPPLIGYMISGMGIGWCFTETGTYLQDIGSVALIVLMFTAGLHLDLTTFSRDAKASVKFTFIQMAFVGLFGIFVLLLPTTLWNLLIRYGHLISILIFVLFYLATRGRQIQHYFEHTNLSSSIVIITSVIVIFLSAALSMQVFYSSTFIGACIYIMRSIFLPLALFPVCTRIPNKIIQILLSVLILIYGAFQLLLSSNLDTGLIQKKVLFSLAIGIVLYLVPSYLSRANKIAKYVAPGVFVVQASLAIGSLWTPSLNTFIPLFTIMEFRHVQILFMMVGLFAIHSTAIAFKLMETKPIGYPNDTQTSAMLIKPAIKGILIAQDLLTVVLLIALRSFSDTKSLTLIPGRIIVAMLILYCAKKISKAKPSFVSRFMDYMVNISLELTTLFAMTFCFVCAFLGDLIGLSDLYGGFVGGFLLGNIHQHRKAILTCCEPIGDMLMVFFFIHIGFLLKMDAVMANLPVIIFTNAMIIGIKYFANYQSALISYPQNEESGFDKSCLVLMSILMTQVTEFWFLFINIVEPIFVDQGLAHFFEVVRSSCMVSLTLGCLLTVLIRQYMYTRRIYK